MLKYNESKTYFSDTSVGIGSEESITTLFPIDSVIEFDFNPSTKALPTSLDLIQESLMRAKEVDRKLQIRTCSPLILILVPLLISFRDMVEVVIECNNHNYSNENVNLTDETSETIAKTKRFKELLDAAQILHKHSICVSFAKKINNK